MCFFPKIIFIETIFSQYVRIRSISQALSVAEMYSVIIRCYNSTTRLSYNIGRSTKASTSDIDLRRRTVYVRRLTILDFHGIHQFSRHFGGQQQICGST